MAGAPGCFIDWSQLASELDFEVIARMNSPLLSGETVSHTSFAELLAPISRHTCREMIHQVELQLQVVTQTLAMLEGQTFDVILQDMLCTFALKVGEILNADRTSVFLVDTIRQELWSIVTEADRDLAGFEIRLPWHQGIAGEVAMTRQVLNVPFDFYDDPRSAAAKKLEAQTGYRTYTLLALPVLDAQGNLLAVVELLNKRLPNSLNTVPLIHRIDLEGFTAADEATFQEFSDVFRLILESSQAFYQAARRQRSAMRLVKATQALNYSGASLSATLKQVKREAQHLVEADRSTIWLRERDRPELWTRVPTPEGTWTEIRIPIGTGCAGKVAATGTILNLPCDVYAHPDVQLILQLDQTTGYRTYSLLCMPMFDTAGQLIAVTQLFNKCRLGAKKRAFMPDRAEIPPCFQTNFNDDDEFFMLAFNIHAGAAIERALMYEALQKQVHTLEAQIQDSHPLTPHHRQS
jgi:adenylate cyclase